MNASYKQKPKIKSEVSKMKTQNGENPLFTGAIALANRLKERDKLLMGKKTGLPLGDLPKQWKKAMRSSELSEFTSLTVDEQKIAVESLANHLGKNFSCQQWGGNGRIMTNKDIVYVNVPLPALRESGAIDYFFDKLTPMMKEGGVAIIAYEITPESTYEDLVLADAFTAFAGKKNGNAAYGTIANGEADNELVKQAIMDSPMVVQKIAINMFGFKGKMANFMGEVYTKWAEKLAYSPAKADAERRSYACEELLNNNEPLKSKLLLLRMFPLIIGDVMRQAKMGAGKMDEIKSKTSDPKVMLAEIQKTLNAKRQISFKPTTAHP